MVRARPGSERFRQANRLKTPREFRRVFQGGEKTVGRFFVVFARANQGPDTRLGLAVSRKVGNAVCRNRLKRLVREEFRRYQGLQALDLVVVARTAAAGAGQKALVRDLHSLWERVRNA